MLVVASVACGSHRTAEPEPKATTNEKVTLRPALHVGDKFHYHVEATLDATVTIAGSPQHSKGTVKLDDEVEVTGASQVKERLSNVTADGDGEIGDAMKRLAPILPTATVTTSFDANWQVASSSIDGTQDDEARTMIMNLTPIVSFRLAPKDPVAVGDTWQNQWGESLNSDKGKAAGKVATSVRYTLRGVGACGTRTCATIVGEGEDAIPAQDATSGGTSSFHGEQQVELSTLVPVGKTIESKTVMHGQQQGQAFEYTNTTSVRIERTDR